MDTSGAYKVKLNGGLYTVVLRPGYHYVIGYAPKRGAKASETVWIQDATYVGRLDTRHKFVFELPNGTKRYIHEDAITNAELTVDQQTAFDREELLTRFRTERENKPVDRVAIMTAVTQKLAAQRAQQQHIDDLIGLHDTDPKTKRFLARRQQERQFANQTAQTRIDRQKESE